MVKGEHKEEKWGRGENPEAHQHEVGGEEESSQEDWGVVVRGGRRTKRFGISQVQRDVRMMNSFIGSCSSGRSNKMRTRTCPLDWIWQLEGYCWSWPSSSSGVVWAEGRVRGEGRWEDHSQCRPPWVILKEEVPTGYINEGGPPSMELSSRCQVSCRTGFPC